MQRASKRTNVQIMDTVVSRDEVHALYHLCDCYVSLHRSEGFGFTPAEAMSAGKPVIATGYGGNVDFMTPDNSYIVKHKLIEIDRDHGPYRRGWIWADPDLDHAAQLMRRVYENREEARAIGRKAREDVRRLLRPRVVGDLIRRRLLRIAWLLGITVPDQWPSGN
jgi:glycosyltransferase involved in cell wall biosynthesis